MFLEDDLLMFHKRDIDFLYTDNPVNQYMRESMRRTPH